MKKVLVLLLLTPMIFGAISVDKKYKLNHRMGKIAEEVGLGTLLSQGGTSDLALDGIQPLMLARATYDFSTMGGSSVSTGISLGQTIPSGAILIRSWIDIVTAPTSLGSATIAIQAQNANDVKTATQSSSYSGRIEGAQTGAASAFTKLTAAGPLLVKIGTADLTAGKFTVFVEYVMGH